MALRPSAGKATFFLALVVLIALGAIPLFLRSQQRTEHAAPAAAPAVTTESKSNPPGENAPTSTLGTFDGKTITRESLNAGERIKLYDAEQKVYQTVEEILLQRKLNDFFEAYAKEHGLPNGDAGQKAYVASKQSVQDAEVKAFLEQNKDNPGLKSIPEEQRLARVRDYMEGQARNRVLGALVSEIRGKNEVQVSLPRPAEPKLEVPASKHPAFGGKGAKVVLDEFADFQCPYCAQMLPELTDLMKKYSGQVEWRYHDFPLHDIHPQAIPASVAAQCADDQGKFWEMHNALFDNYRTLSDSLYPELAKKLGLDADKFKSCLQNPETVAKVKAHENQGADLGVNGTPSYFVNGRRMAGRSSDEFERVFKEEIEKAK